MTDIKQAIKLWITQNGSSDPRPMLDSYFWSYICNNKQLYDDTLFEIDAWCNNTIGEDHWHRLFNKYWFTSQEDFLLFTLTWGGEQINSDTEFL